MKFHNLLLLFFVVIFSSDSALALSTDRQQPINIEADTASIDNVNGVAIYEGDVIVTQGSIRLTAEKVTLNYSKKQEIEKLIAEGKIARFKQRLDNGEDITAQAKLMEYNALKSMLYLKRAAKLQKSRKGVNSYTSTAPYITYDTKAGLITANQNGRKKGRIKMTLKPQPKKK